MPEMKSSIALIGFMGVGKTAVGQVLAKRLNKQFVELDALIEQKVGKTIAEIFQQDGEVAFRELEIEVIKEIAQNRDQVIACGGGVVLNKINIDRLKKDSLMVYLTASPKVILKRVASSGARPLLKVDDPAVTIRQLLRFRRPFYERAADVKIDTSRMAIDSIAEQIIQQVKKDYNFSLEK
jgi:shikimate kinase